MSKRSSAFALFNDRKSLSVMQGMLALIALAAALSFGFVCSSPVDRQAEAASVADSLPEIYPSIALAPVIAHEDRPVIEPLLPLRDVNELPLADTAEQKEPLQILPPAAVIELDQELAGLIAGADEALVQSLARFGLDSAHILVEGEEIRLSPNKAYYRFNKLVVLPPVEWESMDENQIFALVQSMADSLRIWAPDFRLQQVNSHLYFIMKDELVTHSVQLGPEQESDAVLPPLDADLPQLTIIIDDMGESLSAARRLAALPYPVTFSIWPLGTHASFTANLAREAGRQVFIHLPMEPLNASGQAVGPETMLVGMPQDQLLEIVSNALYLVPEAQGLNNHMGSLFTADLASVASLCNILGQLAPEFLVVDSRTHQSSLFQSQAEAAGLQAYGRDLFLDEDDKVEAVLAQLDRGLQLALSKGRAILIGHPRPATLEALEAWQSYRGSNAIIVPVGYSSGSHTNNQE